MTHAMVTLDWHDKGHAMVTHGIMRVMCQVTKRKITVSGGRESVRKWTEFGLMLFIEVVAASINLMLGFESPKSDLYSLSYGPFLGTTTT